MTGRTHRPDYVLILSVVALLGIGLIMIYSLSPILSNNLGSKDNYYFLRQVISFGLGIGAWIFASSVSYEKWRGWSRYLTIAAVVSVLALFVPALSVTRNGATRWLDFGPISFQPAELLKPAVIIYLAIWLEKNRNNIRSFWDGLVPFGAIMGVVLVVVGFFQRDLGTLGVIAAAGILMYLVAGMRWDHFGILALAGTGVLAVSVLAFSHRLARVAAFLDPTKDASGVSYHVNQALIAIGSGGIFGVGLGRSIQVYGYLPEASNDSIFAVIAEEFGLIGSLAVIGLLGLVAYRGFKIAKTAPDMFSRLVAAGITLWIMSQSIINIAAMLSLVPLTGIPLPFISFGGTNLVITLLAVGILHNISKYTTQEAYAHSSQRRGDSRSHLSDSSYRRRFKVAR